MKLLATILFVVLACIVAAVANQASLFSPTTGTVSGLNLTNNYNSAIDALNTCNSGTTAPVNQLSGVASLGNCWMNTNTAPVSVEIYDGTQWVVRGYLDTASHLWIPNDGSNLGTVASASTTNLCSSPVNTATAGSSELISGTTTITSFGTNCPTGSQELVQFLGSLTLTNSGSLVLPTGANIQTNAGDWAVFIYNGAGVWTCVDYQRQNGAPLSVTGVSITGSALGNNALGFQDTVNLGLTASVASNNLTLCIVANDTGIAPTAGDPAIINFRNSTIGTGTFTTLKATASTCFTINSTNTMGTSNNVPFRLWIVAINNGGTLLVGAYTASNSTSCLKLNEGALLTTGAGANGGSTAQTVQTSVSAVTNAQVKTIGYMEYASGLGTAGIWNATPTYIQIMGPGIKSPCDPVAQYYATQSGSSTTSKTITPQSAADVFLIQCAVNMVSTSAGASLQVTGNRTGLGNIGNAGFVIESTASVTVTAITMPSIDLPGTTASTTYNCIGSNATTFGAGALFLQEIMG